MELFILNTPPLLCVVAEIRINLIDGGQTNRARASLPFALIRQPGLVGLTADSSLHYAQVP